MEKKTVAKLKQFVRECALAGAEAARKVAETSGMARWRHWEKKRAAGVPARHALLAYAYARGVPYSLLEPRFRDGNGLSAIRVEAWLAEAGVPFNDGDVAVWLQGERKAVAA